MDGEQQAMRPSLDLDIVARSSIPGMDDTCTLTLPIDGMTCASCVARVEKALARVPGVREAHVNLATEQASLALDASSPAATAQAVQAAQAAVAKAGYAIPEETRDLRVDGMTCASCVGRVEKAVKRVPGVLEASVNLATGGVRVRRLAGSAGDVALREAITRAGYEATLLSEGDAGATGPRRGELRGWHVAAAALLSAPLGLPMLPWRGRWG